MPEDALKKLLSSLIWNCPQPFLLGIFFFFLGGGGGCASPNFIETSRIFETNKHGCHDFGWHQSSTQETPNLLEALHVSSPNKVLTEPGCTFLGIAYEQNEWEKCCTLAKPLQVAHVDFTCLQTHQHNTLTYLTSPDPLESSKLRKLRPSLHLKGTVPPPKQPPTSLGQQAFSRFLGPKRLT